MDGPEDLRPAALGANSDPTQALAAIRPAAGLHLGTGCAAPRSLIATLEAMEPGPADLEFVSFLTTLASADQAVTPPASRYRHRSFFVGSDIRHLASLERLDYVPISLDEVPELLANGRLPIDVALLQVLASRCARLRQSRHIGGLGACGPRLPAG